MSSVSSIPLPLSPRSQSQSPARPSPPHTSSWAPYRALLNPWVWTQFIRQTLLNIKSSKTHYALGFLACFVVVLFVSVLISLLGQTPIIFLRISEIDRGEADLVISAGTFTGYSRINYTLVQTLLTLPDEKASSPRIQSQRFFISPKSIGLPSGIPDQYLYKSINQEIECSPYCPLYNYPNVSSKWANTFNLDLDKERSIGLGRTWSLNTPLKENEVYVTPTFAQDLGVDVGDIVYTIWNASDITREIFNDTIVKDICPECAKNNTLFEMAEIVWAPVRIVGIFTDMGGKFPKSETAVNVVYNYHTMLEHISKNLNPYLINRQNSTAAKARYNKSNLDDFVTHIYFNIAPPRLPTYLSSSYNTIHSRLISFSNRILFKLGYAQIYVDMPVLRGLSGTKTISIVLGLIMNVIIFILMFLSIVLVYSLLMISVETRRFELGILRMIGMTRPSLVAMLLVQAFMYALPAWIFGTFAAMGVYSIAAKVASNMTNANISRLITPTAFGLSTLIGLLIPILASIFPIREALRQNLQDALDTRHNKVKAVAITLERSEGTGSIPWIHILFGSGLSLFGGIIYYIIPAGLLSMNLPLLMNVFFFILIGMLLGLVLIALNLQHMLERFLNWLFFFWESRGIRTLVIKNLIAHRPRNQKTSILYALSLGFIIFINVAYNIQIDSISSNTKRDFGSHIIAYTETGIDPDSGYVKAIYNKEYFERVKTQFPDWVVDYSWVTTTWRDAAPEHYVAGSSNIGRWVSDTNQFYGASPNFFSNTFPEYTIVEKHYVNASIGLVDNWSQVELSNALYSREGSDRVLVGTTYIDGFDLDVQSEFLIQTKTRSSSDSSGDDSSGVLAVQSSAIPVGGASTSAAATTSGSTGSLTYSQNVTEYLAKPMAFLSQCAQFFYSQFPLMKGQDLVVSIPSYGATGPWKSVEDIPMRGMTIQLKANLPIADVKTICNWLRVNTGTPYLRVSNLLERLEPFDMANKVVSYFFSFTTVIAMAISFFSLMSSMYTNIKEQTREVGIARALGFPKSWVYRTYFYESFLLVMSSSILGIFIGTITSYTMNSQQSLFTQLPISFTMPWLLLLVVFLCAILFSFLASFTPIHRVLRLRIIEIFRG